MKFDINEIIYLPDQYGDYLSRLKMSQAFLLMQDAAEKSAIKAGMGREVMILDHKSFVLSRITLEVDRMPDIYETISLHTWPKGKMKFFYLRDYIFHKDKEPLIRARAVWALFDLKNRTIVSDQRSTAPFEIKETRNSLHYIPSKIKSESQALLVGETFASYSLTDPNGHLNNTRYIEWIYDFLPEEYLIKNLPYKVDINYINEVYYKDRIKIYRMENENVIIEGRVEDKVCFIAKFSRRE